MATTKAGKSKVGKTIKPAAKKPIATRPAAAAKKTASKVPASKKAMKKPVAKKAVATKKGVKKTASNVATKKPAAKQAATSKTGKRAAKTSTATAATRKTPSTGRLAISKAVPKQSATPKPAVANPADTRRMQTTSVDSTVDKASGKITPQQALANIRALLEAKKEHDRQPQPWQRLDQQAGPVDHAGYQSPEAADKAGQLHEGESRMQAIQGNISSTDRKHQGKRDNR